MLRTYAELRQETADRGLHHLGNSRLGLFVEQAAQELHTLELWDFRRAVIAGAAPLAIPAGALVKHVRETSTNRRYWPISESRALNERESQGQPGREYLIEGETSLRTHPEAATELTVVYFTVAPWQTGGDEPGSDEDEPHTPLAWRDIIVELAVCKGLRDDGREDEAAELEKPAHEGGVIERRLDQMRAAVLPDQADEPRYIQPESIW
jgi:hypothetical protein